MSANGGMIGKWPRVQSLILADLPIYFVACLLLASCLAIFAAYDIGFIRHGGYRHRVAAVAQPA